MPDTEIRTFLIADIRGYTSFTQSRGDEAAATLAARFAEIMREAVESRGGEVIELRGDEALAVFASARQALRAAVDAQLVFTDEVALDPTLPFRVGMGIDAGEAVSVEGGYRGGALNLAARLCSKAQPGEVVASQGVVHLARATEGVTFHDHGEFEMKGLPEPVKAVLVTHDGLGPTALGDRLDAAIGTVVDRAVRSDLPSVLDPVTPMVGRDRESRALRWAWREARRGIGSALALVGPAGIGKTRLAAEAASLPAAEGARVVYVGCAETGDEEAAAALAIDGANDGPTLLVVDDAHAAGPQTLRGLAALGAPLSSRRQLLIVTYQEQQASPEFLAVTGPLVGETGTIRPAPLDIEQVRQVAALYFGTAADSLPASTLEATGGIPRKVHEFVGEWAHREASRRLGDAASKTALGRSDLRSVEAELAGSVVDLQFVEEQARLFGAGTPDRGSGEQDIVPFKGLASFDVDDGEWFFGRERLVAELIARLAGASLLGVVGPSGSGKSSAVRAGLVPALRAGALPGSEHWIIAVMRPGEHPLRELDRAMWAAFSDDLRTRLSGADLPLRAVRNALGRDERVMLLVDQFEETFTACADEAERSAFVSAITEAARDPRGNVAVVLAVRADFYGRCAEDPSLASLIGSNHVLVGTMTAEEYRRAIEQPAIRAGLRVEPPLIDALVAEVVDEPGGLPLLSTALLELWELRDGRTLRTGAYVATGGVRGAVARLAEDVFGSLTEAQQGAARSMMLRLAGPGEGDAVVRRRVPLAEFDAAASPDVERALEAFTQRRLLTVSEGTVEVAHEALLREWPRLQGWIEDDRAGLRIRAHLTEAAKEWEEGGEDPGELYRGTRLGSALDWTADHTLDLNDLERRFLGVSNDASRREAEQQQRTNRRLRGLLSGVAVLLVLALVAGAIAVVQRTNAQTAATDALGQSVGAQGVTQSQLSRGLLLAREGVNLAPSTHTEGSLLSTLLRAPGVTRTFTGPESERPLQVALVDHDRTVATGMNSSAIHFYDTATASALGTFPASSLGVICCAQAPGGQAIAVKGAPNVPATIFVIDPRTGRTTRTFPPEAQFPGASASNPVNVVGLFNGPPGGRTLFVGYYLGNKPTLWIERADAATGRLIDTTGVPNAPFLSGMNLTNGGSRLSLVSNLGETELDTSSMQVVRSVPFAGAGAFGATNSDASRAAFTTNENGAVRFIDLRSGKITDGFGGPITQVNALQFSPTDPTLAVTTGDDGRIVLWNAVTARADQVLPLYASRVTSAAFSSDGSKLFTTSLDGTTGELSLAGRGGFGTTFSVLPPGVDPVAQSRNASTAPLVATADGRVAFQRGQASVMLVSSLTGKQTSFDAAPPGFIIQSLAFSPDGNTLAVSSEDGATLEQGNLRLWDVSVAPRLARTLPLTVPYPSVNQVQFADGGRTLFAGTGNSNPDTGAVLGGYLMGWHTSDGSLVFPPVLFKGYSVKWLSVNSNSTLLALGLNGNQAGPVRVLRMSDRKLLGSIPDIPTGSQSVTFAQDGTLLTGAWSGQVQRWSVPALRPLGRPVLSGSGPVAAVSPEPHSTFFVTANYDGTTRLWDLTSGQQIGSSFTPLESRWVGAAISPDGRSLAILAADGTAWTFPLSEAIWARQACRVASRNLTRTEWSQFIGDRPYAKVCPQYPLSR